MKRLIALVVVLELASTAAAQIRPSAANSRTAGARQSKPQPEVSGQPSTKFFGLDFGPYTDGQNPTVSPVISATTLTARLQLVAPYANWIRTYSSTNGLENIPQIAKSMGLKVAAEAYISSNLADNSQEIANLIANGQQGLVDVAIVGNEALLYNYVTASTLIGYIQQVQQALPGIPVATADTWNTLVANPAVIAAGSIVLPEIYPYWEGAAIENALAQTINEYQQVTAVAAGLPVWIAEAGWPASGDTEGAAVPSPANQGDYALNFVNWATAANVNYFFFEALDEPWKGSADEEGPQGASWGVLADTGTIKPWMQAVFSNNGLTCNTATPSIVFTFIPPFGDPITNIEGTACGIDAVTYSIQGYLYVEGTWWIKPYLDAPLTIPNAADGFFSINVDTGGVDYDATQYAAFVIPNSAPPSTYPPSNSVAMVQVSRSQNGLYGYILDAYGNPLSGVLLTLTGTDNGTTISGPSGEYSFVNIAGTGADVVTPSLLNYSFSPSSISFPPAPGAQAGGFVGNSQTSLSALPSVLQFSAYTAGGGAPPAPLTFNVTSENPDSDSYYTTIPGSTCGWLSLSAATGLTPGTLTASVNSAGLTANTYTCSLAINTLQLSTQVTANLLVIAQTAVTSPAPGITLSDDLADFSWNPLSGATEYQLSVGTTPGSGNIFSGTTTATSQTVSSIPCNGGTIYVQLSAEVNGSFQPPNDSSYPCKSAIGDFNGDGFQDLVWQNNSTGQVNVNYYGGAEGAVFQGWACLSCGIDTTNWQVVGTGDFDGNGTPDLVYQNTQTGQVNVDYYGGSDGATFIGWACLSCGIDTIGWHVAAVADFNGDGVPDLVYQNTQTSQVNVDYYGGSGGAVFQGYACLSCGINVTGWQVKAAADFDGNGVPDLVYQNQSTNQVNVDYYEGPGGATFKGWACLSCGVSVAGWTLVGANDFDGNGVPDLVYQNLSLGQLNVNYYGGPGGAVIEGWNALNNYPGWTAIVPKSR